MIETSALTLLKYEFLNNITTAGSTVTDISTTRLLLARQPPIGIETAAATNPTIDPINFSAAVDPNCCVFIVRIPFRLVCFKPSTQLVFAINGRFYDDDFHVHRLRV